MMINKTAGRPSRGGAPMLFNMIRGRGARDARRRREGKRKERQRMREIQIQKKEKEV